LSVVGGHCRWTRYADALPNGKATLL
jgi:hypothetical protein